MHHPRPLPALAAALALLPLSGCGQGDVTATAQRPPRVFTTFYPTSYLAERIADGAAEVICPLPPGEDPIFWQPPRAVLADYQAADLIVINGAGLERWLASASLPESRVVDTTKALAGNLLTFEATTHSHGPGGEHTHEGLDGHTWVDPLNAKLQARAIWVALTERMPAEAARFEAARQALDRDLDALDARLRELGPALSRARLLASHPAYDYLARRHGLALANLDLDPAAVPDEAQLAAVGAALEASAGDGPALLLWESEPLPEAAALLRERFGLESVLVSPCEGLPAAGEDYLSVQHANLDRLAAALGA